MCAVTFLYYSNCGMCFCNTVLVHYVSVCTFLCCPGVDIHMAEHFSLSLSAPCLPYVIHVNHPGASPHLFSPLFILSSTFLYLLYLTLSFFSFPLLIIFYCTIPLFLPLLVLLSLLLHLCSVDSLSRTVV